MSVRQARDVNECLQSNNGGCHVDAVCRNLDALASAGKTHECICPPGMNGDGIRRCDQMVYMTQFGIRLNAVPEGVVLDLQLLVQRMYADGAFPASVMIGDIEVSLKGAEGTGGRRRSLLDTGSELQVVIISDSPEAMQSVTESIDTNATVGALCSVTNQTDGCASVDEPPVSTVKSVDQAFGPVTTVLAGMSISSVQLDSNTGKWVVHLKYKHDVPNTIASMYMSMPGKRPYSELAKNSFYVSMHPCMRSNSVCCMIDYKNRYEIGPFQDNITEAVGTCPNDVKAMDTLSMWSLDHNKGLVDNFFSKYPQSSVQRISDTEVNLRISTADLRETFAMVEDVSGGKLFPQNHAKI